MDFDPRDRDSRDDERFGAERHHGRDGTHDFDGDDDWRRPEDRSRDRDDDVRTLGRGPGDSRDPHADGDSRDRHHVRWLEREPPDRAFDPREPFTRGLNLPRGLEREIVRDRDRAYTLRGSETRTLATVGAFRVVSSRDLRDHHGRSADPRYGDLRHLREQGLVRTVRVPGSREHAVALTKEGLRCAFVDAIDLEVVFLFDKLVRRGFAIATDCIHNRARLYHVHHRPLYHAIGELTAAIGGRCPHGRPPSG